MTSCSKLSAVASMMNEEARRGIVHESEFLKCFPVPVPVPSYREDPVREKKG